MIQLNEWVVIILMAAALCSLILDETFFKSFVIVIGVIMFIGLICMFAALFWSILIGTPVGLVR